MTHSDFLPASRPVLWDLRSCEEWLSRATLADARQACSALLALLDDLEDAPPRHAIYLQILERLREPLLIAQAENAKKFAAKPLPLGHAESAAFAQSTDLWLAALRSYRRLLRAALKGNRPELAPSLPLLCARATECAAELIICHFAGRREVSEDYWRWLHEAYALAERKGMAEVDVAEPRSRLPASMTCASAYVRPLMLELAQPYALRERELLWTRRWTQRWAGKVRIVASDPGVDGYHVDAHAPAVATWEAGAPEPAHRLDFDGVERSIRWRLKKLSEGATPSELGLGRDCIEPAAGDLLRILLASWTRPRKTRSFPRHATQSSASVICGLAQIHAALGGKATGMDAPARWNYSRRHADPIHVFGQAQAGDAAARIPRRPPVPVVPAAAEQWDMLDESAGGFRLRRKGPGTGMGHRQLVALRPPGAAHFILSELRWIVQSADGAITAGARAMVGIAQPTGVRPLAEAGVKPGPFVPALVLPVARALPETLVLPLGWHQPGRVLEIQADGDVLRLRLTELLARGYDFDHARFEPIPEPSHAGPRPA